MTGYTARAMSFECFSLNLIGVGSIDFECEHLSEDEFKVSVRDGNSDEIFRGSLEELIEKLEASND